jgi:hypothetical protein
MVATIKKPAVSAPTSLADPSNPAHFASLGARPGAIARPADAATARSAADDLQGEGNYRAARIFNGAERKFVASGRVIAAARAAAPRTEAGRLKMLAAEKEGQSRSAGDDPAVAGIESAPARPEPPAKGAYQDRG